MSKQYVYTVFVQGWYGDCTQGSILNMENHVEENMDNEMATAGTQGSIGS